MRPVRFTKAEAAACRAALVAAPLAVNRKAAEAALAKLDAADGEAPKGVAVGPIEQALVRASRGKVVELEGGAAYGRASKMATAQGVTLADAEMVGAWLARQGWLREPTTLLGVLNKWAEWLPRARATAPPPAAQEGFDGTATAPAGPPGPGARGGGGRRGEGFR